MRPLFAPPFFTDSLDGYALLTAPVNPSHRASSLIDQRFLLRESSVESGRLVLISVSAAGFSFTITPTIAFKH